MQAVRGGTPAARGFWWDRERPVDACPLRAVVFDVDALAGIDRDGDVVARAGLIDLVMSLFVAGIWVAVVSPGRRAEVEPLVRQVVGEGLVETIVTADDVTDPGPATGFDTGLYRLALWELGITPDAGLAITGSLSGARAAAGVGMPVLAVTGRQFSGALAVCAGYQDSGEPLLAADCRALHRRWWIAINELPASA
jgi:beta-phosphoglucomutase-like phosphatase (HAD superfamily)